MSCASQPPSSASRSGRSVDSAATASSASLRLVSWRPSLDAIRARLHSSVGNNCLAAEEEKVEEDEDRKIIVFSLLLFVEASWPTRGVSSSSRGDSMMPSHARMARAYASKAAACCPDCARGKGWCGGERERDRDEMTFVRGEEMRRRRDVSRGFHLVKCFFSSPRVGVGKVPVRVPLASVTARERHTPRDYSPWRAHPPQL